MLHCNKQIPNRMKSWCHIILYRIGESGEMSHVVNVSVAYICCTVGPILWRLWLLESAIYSNQYPTRKNPFPLVSKVLLITINFDYSLGFACFSAGVSTMHSTLSSTPTV